MRTLFVLFFCLGLFACVDGENSSEVAAQVLDTCKLAKPVVIDPKVMVGDGYRFTRVVLDHQPELYAYQSAQNLSEQEISFYLFNLKTHDVASGVIGGRLEGHGNEPPIGFADDDEGDFDFEHSEEAIEGGTHYLTTYAALDSNARTTFEMIIENNKIMEVSFTYPGNTGVDKLCLKSFSL